MAPYTIARVECVQFCYDRRLVTRRLSNKYLLLNTRSCVEQENKDNVMNLRTFIVSTILFSIAASVKIRFLVNYRGEFEGS